MSVLFKMKPCSCEVDTMEGIIYCPMHAAAPELLEACKLALNAFERNYAINWDDLARAIEKAEGAK